MTAPLGLEVFGEAGKATSLDDSFWAVRTKSVANMGTQAIKNR